MSSHIAAVHQFYEVFNTRDISVFDDILAEDWQPLPPVPGNPGGRNGQKGTVAYLNSVLSSVRYTVEEIYECSPDVVTCRCALKAVHSGPFLGLAPTGATIELMTMEFHYFKNGRIAATRHIEDFFGVYEQLLAAGAKPVGG